MATHHSVNFQLQNSISDTNGRYLILNCTIDNSPITLATIYAPNNPQVYFLNKVMKKVWVQKGSLILCGDFNIVPDEQIDTSNPRSGQNSAMGKCINVNDLYDVRRCHHPGKREYTYHSPVHKTYNRIDYILTDKRMLQWAGESDIAPTTFLN